MITLYALTGADETRRFSPYCWRIRMSLRHKGLAFEGVPWRCTEKERIAPAGAQPVPVIRDGERRVHDSMAIAEYLKERYPDRPSLFGSRHGAALARFVAGRTDRTVQLERDDIMVAWLARMDEARDGEGRRALGAAGMHDANSH